MKHLSQFISRFITQFISPCILAGLALLLPTAACGQATPKATTLMHEMRTTPSPLNNATVGERSVTFMWPLPDEMNTPVNPLDGMEHKVKSVDKTKLQYQIRYSQDIHMKKNVTTVTRPWPFYHPEQALKDGVWYWQYGYVSRSTTRWSQTLKFTQKAHPNRFAPPSFQAFVSKLPSTHPRVFLDGNHWDGFITQSQSTLERNWYLQRAEKTLKVPMQHIGQTDTSKIAGLDNEVKRNALLTRESRRIVDKEEPNTEVFIRAYLLTKENRYFEEAMKRIGEMVKWAESPNFVGDFNESTLLSLSSMAYDAFYDQLSADQKSMLLKEIKTNGSRFYQRFNNHLENHIADNHTWQMALRIFTMAAFSVYGDLPEATIWADYCYNVWLARFPGLNQDGGWHNGDSYFHVNIRTLIEVPYFYSRISGFDFFADSWYQGSALYTLYQQPPFSKSAGNGSSHQKVVRPNGVRVGYADALARMTGNSYAADYARRIQQQEPNILQKAFLAKPGDLAWFRLQSNRFLPGNRSLPGNQSLPEGKGLKDLPLTHVFPQTGIATLMSNWDDLRQNAMLTFRSSPYGSTSHAIANQNAFNTFFNGKPLFYSSGHHISFTDEHSVYCHRSTRAHNTILVNGMGQRIGTEGYGWIPRHYVGKGISYLTGDASNAYGEVISPLWLERGRDSHLDYSPANGWDKNRLKTFRRHVVALGDAGLTFIYDELEADTAVTWSYLLHTTENPMTVQKDITTHITATNSAGGISDAWLFAPDELTTEQTDQFFYPAVNWLRADDKGNFPPLENHWHFKATSPHRQVYRFATLISTHGKEHSTLLPERVSENTLKVGKWIITMNLSLNGKAAFTVENKEEGIRLEYNDSTRITENGSTTVLKDEVPELEI